MSEETNAQRPPSSRLAIITFVVGFLAGAAAMFFVGGDKTYEKLREDYRILRQENRELKVKLGIGDPPPAPAG